ncbi:hypothetical protein [Streptomyces sp. CBMA123]|uniref:hypothetical protein n=1 Tax=Streptomyces sp. CBMA123 TaxID=1896313 RepID=UPI001661D209|nr:hypothetical protein [Streptomyces sp. CBMA123]MBD0691569.1 hypothetical protein [Streptomyces sp. CBMA123]
MNRQETQHPRRLGLDGSEADTFPASEPVRPPGRTLVRTCMSRPGVAVTPGADFATVTAVLIASDTAPLPHR